MLHVLVAATVALHNPLLLPGIHQPLYPRVRSLDSCRASVVAMDNPPPPRPSTTLLIGDAGAVLVYSLGLSTMRTFALAFQQMLAPGFDVGRDLASMDLHLTVQYINIETLSAMALTMAWLVGGTMAGACDETWFPAARERGVLPSLLRGWALASPIALLTKAVAVAAVMLPVGGWLAFDLPTATADLGGILASVSLWRTLFLQMV